MNLNKANKGVLYALGAAALNGTIGMFSKLLMALQLESAWIALIKTVMGAVLITLLLAVWRRPGRQGVPQRYAALAAFFGIFMLFYFETSAYGRASAANVVLVLMASSAVTANLAGWMLLGDRPHAYQWLGVLLTVAGMGAILGIDASIDARGLLLSACAGMGYGIFTVLLKKIRAPGGLVLTRQLLCWGAVFLAVPAARAPLAPATLLSAGALLPLLGLAVLPSVLGFFCTCKAVNYLPPARVQLLELSEPLFTASFAFLVLGESVTLATVAGAILTLLGIYVGAIWGSAAAQEAAVTPAPAVPLS